MLYASISVAYSDKLSYVLVFSQLFVASPWRTEVQCSSGDSELEDEGDLLLQAGLLPTYPCRVSQHNQ